jgi:very-short-patch-repair endonuclease
MISPLRPIGAERRNPFDRFAIEPGGADRKAIGRVAGEVGLAMPLRARTEIARRLRRDATDVEKILWRALRERLPLWKFRRQHPIGRRIADFACPARKLVIELDGGQHSDRIAADERRAAEIVEHGYRIIRFWNNQVLESLQDVLETIRIALLEAPPPHPTSPPPEGAERGRV